MALFTPHADNEGYPISRAIILDAVHFKIIERNRIAFIDDNGFILAIIDASGIGLNADIYFRVVKNSMPAAAVMMWFDRTTWWNFGYENAAEINRKTLSIISAHEINDNWLKCWELFPSGVERSEKGLIIESP
jgi:hypothetical protein